MKSKVNSHKVDELSFKPVFLLVTQQHMRPFGKCKRVSKWLCEVNRSVPVREVALTALELEILIPLE
jgi:hypothetical protein